MKKISHLPLSVKLPLLVAAMMVLVGAVASQQVLSALARVQDARVQELAQLHVEGLSVALGPLVLRYDIWEVYDTLDRASKGADGQRMILTAVADTAGRVLAATDPRRVPIDSDIARIAEGAVALENLSVNGSNPLLRLLTPLIYQGRPVGQIASELDVSDLLAERRQALLSLILGNAVAIGLLSLAGFLAIRKMLWPVTMLAHQMTETQGQPHPVPDAEIPRGNGEFARLAHIYNSMVDAVATKAETERRLAARERFVALGRLSSSLAHEINNPLGGLLNATDTIRNFADRPEVVRQSADLLDRGLRHLRDVTRVTLDQNRLDHDDRYLKAEDFEDLKLLIQPEVSRLMLDLDWSVLLRTDSPVAIAAGPIRQIVLNLLLNGCTAAGQRGRVALAVEHKDHCLFTLVTNSGPEMPQAARDRLMTNAPFEPGGGVGLRLVREMACALGGQVAYNRKDGLTSVRVTFSLAKATDDAPE